MPANYYDDTGEAAAAPAAEAKSQPTETTTIPKSMCPGMKVGDSVELKIVRDLEGEYEVAYEEGESESEGEYEGEMPEEEPTAAPPGPGAMSEMAGMMQ